MTDHSPTLSPAATLFLATACAVVAFLLYVPGFDGEFVFDDRKLVVENEELWRPYTSIGDEISFAVDRVTGIFRAEESDREVRTAFRPIRFLSLRIDVWVTRSLGLIDPATGDPSPRVFHAHNALLHALNVLFLVLLVRSLRPRSPWWGAALFALAFALHPVHTESVTYISGRRDVLFLFFYLCTLLVYVRGREHGGWGRGIGLALLTWCALGSKEMAVSLPITLLLLEGIADRVAGDRPGWRRIVDRLPLWSPAFLVALTFAVLLLTRQNPGGGTGWWGGTPWLAAVGSGRAVLSYCRLMLLPHPLTVDYSFDAFPASTSLFSPFTGLASWIVIIAFAVTAFRLRHRSPLFATAVALFAVTIAPVAQWVPHPERFAEHHLYLPSLALLLLAVPIIERCRRRSPEATVATLGLVLLVWGGMTIDRLETWRTPYTLWKDAAEVHPRCARAHFGWGNAAQLLDPPRPDEAVRALGRAIELWDSTERDRLQQGYFLQSLRIRSGVFALSETPADLERARDDLERLLRETDTDGTPVSDDAINWHEYMKVRVRLGDHEGAVQCAQRILALEAPAPIRVSASLFLAADRAERGDMDGAEEILVTTMARHDEDRSVAAIWYQLGVIRQGQERYGEAIEAFENAADRIGRDGNRTSALYKAAECSLYRQDPAGARTFLEDVLSHDPRHLPSHLSLGEIVLGAGELERATEHFLEVLRAVPDEPRAREGLARILARERAREPSESDAIDPTKVTTFLMLAERKFAEENWADATQALLKAEEHAVGPAERERRLAIRGRIARTYVRRSALADRAGDLETKTAQLQLAAVWYEKVRAMATAAERGAEAVEAAEVERRLHGAKAALALLTAEFESGVTDDRVVRALVGLAELAEDANAYLRWSTIFREREDLPSGSDDPPGGRR